MSPARSPRRPPMSDTHKQALARGREEGRTVRRYLEAVDRDRQRRGRPRTPEALSRRLAQVEHRLAGASALARLHLLQEQADLKAELERSKSPSDLMALEKAFVKVAKGYAQRKGIGYAAWRAAGVPAHVLTKAGITRSG